MTATRNKRRIIEGRVTSNKMTRTITVLVERTYKHPKYKKYVRKAAKYHAHDEEGIARIGDRVAIMACRPMSRLKRWTLVSVVEKSTLTDVLDTASTAEASAYRAREVELDETGVESGRSGAATGEARKVEGKKSDAPKSGAKKSDGKKSDGNKVDGGAR